VVPRAPDLLVGGLRDAVDRGRLGQCLRGVHGTAATRPLWLLLPGLPEQAQRRQLRRGRPVEARVEEARHLGRGGAVVDGGGPGVLGGVAAAAGGWVEGGVEFRVAELGDVVG